MKVPLRWLSEYVEITLPVEQLAERLTFAGLEVEGTEYYGVPQPAAGPDGKTAGAGLAWERDKIVVAEIAEVMPHPNADRLVLVKLYDGEREHTVLTGAPNLFEYKGRGPLAKPLKVVYAKEGATLYDGHQPGRQLMTLKRAKIRGFESYSMACSEKELGISDEHEGIILLDDDAPVGAPFADYLGDVVLNVAITPNQARNANLVGVARELGALTGQALCAPSLEVEATGPGIEGQVSIEIREPDLNPRFTAALIKGVTIGPSPYWMQYRLRLAGMRPINNIVDVTNYVMLELGQPLHAFDYDVLVKRAGGRPPTIITRLPQPGETLTTLDGVERRLDDFTILVADTKGVLSLGGIMGGAESEVSDRTTSVLLEAAAWEYINIRRTVAAQRLHSSEAGYRFSRGVHPAMAERGLRRAIELMRQVAGGEIAQGIVDEYPKPAPVVQVDLPLSEVERILGVDLPAEEVAGILERLGFGVETRSQKSEVGSQNPTSDLRLLTSLFVTVPDHRLDIGAGVVGQADLIEEIARIYGYDRLPETQMSDTIPPQRGNRALEREERVRDLLVACGLQEVVNYRLTTPEREARLTPGQAPAEDRPYVTLANPIASDRVAMRHTLLAGLLDNAAANLRYRDRLALFEIGPVYWPAEGQELPEERARLGIVMTGPREPASWRGGDRNPLDYYDLKGVVDALAADLHLPGVSYAPAEHPTYHPGRTAELSATRSDGESPISNPQSLGLLGELHPLVREAFGLPVQPVLAAEFDLADLLAAIPDRYRTRAVPVYPPVLEDLAVIVDESVAGDEVEAAIRAAGGELVAGVRLFDLYRGEQIGAGKKSLAYSIAYQAPDRTLTDAEVAKVRAEIVRRLEQAVGARLRG
jgi:phenylalanyl-tRNA synthetase beta chain